MTNEKIIAKVQKLLQLAGNNPNEAERDAAMKKALSILGEHNLTMGHVNDQKGEDDVGRGSTLGRSGPWIRTAYNCLGQLYFCSYVYSTWNRKTQHTFIGTAENIAVAKEMAAWITAMMWKEGMKGKREGNWDNSYLTSFLNVGSQRLNARIQTLIQKAKEGDLQSETGNALVLAGVYDQAKVNNKKFIDEEMNVKSSKARHMDVSNYAGATDGRKFADKINLGGQVGSSGKAKVLK